MQSFFLRVVASIWPQRLHGAEYGADITLPAVWVECCRVVPPPCAHMCVPRSPVTLWWGCGGRGAQYFLILLIVKLLGRR